MRILISGENEPNINSNLYTNLATYLQGKDLMSHPENMREKVEILPGKLTCPLKINGWKMYFLLK